MNYFIYIPPEFRQRNILASCVFASVTNCLRTVGLYDKAEKFWNTYKGDPDGESPEGISYKLTKFGIKHAVVRDEQSLLNSLKFGRGCAVSWGGWHCVNLIGKYKNYYCILDNQGDGTRRYHTQIRSEFLQDWKSSGGWGVIILSGKPPKPIYRDGLGEYEK